MKGVTASLHRWLNAAFSDAGFAQWGVASVPLAERFAEDLMQYIENGYHGDMIWLERRADQRANPSALWPDARSAIICAMDYGPDCNPLTGLAQRDRGNISVYARGDDYHQLIKGRLKNIAQGFASRAGARIKIFVDTAPVMEKPLAALAGLGWQGKHTNLVSRKAGSWTFLGVILTDAVLPPNSMETDHCGTCRQCLDICPTGAFPAPYQIDARRCISYLTIEHGGDIPEELRGLMGNRIFGCDDCLAVCPWNKFARRTKEIRLRARKSTNLPPLNQLAKLDDAAFRRMFAKSPVKRIGRDRFIRNVAVALGNCGDIRAMPAVEKLCNDPHSQVRHHAEWARNRLVQDA